MVTSWIGLLGAVVLHQEGDLVEEGDPLPLGGPVDDHRGFDHVLEVADAAVVAVLLPLGRLVFKVFAEIALSAGFFYSLESFGRTTSLR